MTPRVARRGRQGPAPEVYEIDAPAVAALIVSAGDEGDTHIGFRTLRYEGPTQDKVVELMGMAVGLVRSQLQDMAFDYLPRQPHLILWWRSRPVYEKVGKRWFGYARVATTPPVPEMIWQQISRPGGQLPIQEF